MHKDDARARVASLHRLTLEELAAFAIREKLIDACEAFDDRVIITQGDHRFVLPPRQASTFLIGMLRGRSWYVDEPLTQIPDASADADASPSAIGALHRGDLQPSLETTLHSLLTFTSEVGIIDGYGRDEESRSVRIDIPACSTELSYAEAVNYLFDCIQHEMRSMKVRNTPGRSPSNRTNDL